MPDFPSGIFVTGTDTGVGKTRVSLGLMQALQNLGLRVAGMKPVASGCEFQDGRWTNGDARLLQAQASMELPYSSINPYSFELPIAPHIAAAQAGVRIDIPALLQAYRNIAGAADVTVVEGAGGWLAPLGEDLLFRDLVAQLNIPVILVVGMRLGCINHGLLSAESIRNSGLSLAGWVANEVEANMPMLEENIATLTHLLPAVNLGRIRFQALAKAEDTASQLALEGLGT